MLEEILLWAILEKLCALLYLILCLQPIRNKLKLSTPQFHTDPPSSTNRFHTRTTPFQHPKSLSSTPKTPLLNTKSLSSTPKTPQFNTPLSSTPKPLSSTQKKTDKKLRGELN